MEQPPTFRAIQINLEGLIISLYGSTSSQQYPVIHVSLICPASRVLNSANCHHTFIIITHNSCCQDETRSSLKLTFLWVCCSPLRCRSTLECNKLELRGWRHPGKTTEDFPEFFPNRDAKKQKTTKQPNRRQPARLASATSEPFCHLRLISCSAAVTVPLVRLHKQIRISTIRVQIRSHLATRSCPLSALLTAYRSTRT